MSTLAYSYSEPYKLPAGILALVVHGAFFALLYLGVSWRTEPPQGMAVDIWDALPSPQVEPIKTAPPPMPQVAPPKAIETPQLAEPVVQPKHDIALPSKKKQTTKPPAPVKPIETRSVPLKKTEPVQVDKKALRAEAVQEGQENARAAQLAATGKIVNEFTLKIIAKIRRNIVMPPDVADDAQAEFDVTLLPDGEVLGDPKLVKSSGNAAYDTAVARAIMKAQSLPLPPDVTLFNKYFRKLHLVFRPKE